MKPNPKTEPLVGQVEVLLPSAAPHGFDYLVPAGLSLAPGELVRVPLGRGESIGVVWGKGAAKLASGKMKEVRGQMEFPPLGEAMRGFVDWAAWYNCAPKGAILKMVLPLDDMEKKGRMAPLPIQDIQNIKIAQLSGEQKTAADHVEKHLGKGFSVTLLDGITGSGKTEVYFDAIAKTLQSNPQHQALVLLPEIALSVQWLERFKERFGFEPVIWNSQVTAAKKRLSWQAIARSETRVVVGARSALFLPYPDLSLVIVDEEHDGSYKQEEGVIYHARDMAVARGRFEKFPVVLVTATPSLETYHNVKQAKYHEVTLRNRHNEAKLPDIHMIDMRKEKIKASLFISALLREKLTEALANGHQSMLFLNRRGYAPLVLCRTCGHRFQCAQCSAWLVLHARKPSPLEGEGWAAGNAQRNQASSTPLPSPPAQGGREKLVCHHCGHTEPLPKACPTCGSKEDMHACGPGVERILQEVQEFLPNARVGVMASDQLTGYEELEQTINDMQAGKLDILIGTQMIAKGHHFSGLAVVGVVDADLGLAGGDLRAAEKTYQLLHQLSGRAGREQVSGAVYLQSYLPEHPVMQALISGDRDAFMQAELAARQNAKMPPFTRLAAVIVEGTKEDAVIKTAKNLAQRHSQVGNVHLLGPAPAPLYMLRGKYRYRLLIKADRNINLPDYMKSWVDSVETPSSVRVKVDIDPLAFL